MTPRFAVYHLRVDRGGQQVWEERMASARRIGAPDAKNRGVLLDAAELLLLEEGYAAVTSR